MTPDQKQQIEQEAAANFPDADGYDFEVQQARLGYITAATKYSSLLEEKDKEIQKLSDMVGMLKSALRGLQELENPQCVLQVEKISRQFNLQP